MIIIIASTTWLYIIGGLTAYSFVVEVTRKRPFSLIGRLLTALFWPFVMTYIFVSAFYDMVRDKFRKGAANV